MKMYIKWLPVLAALLAITGCYNDKTDQLYPEPGNGNTGGVNTNTCDTVDVGYTATIKPLLTQYCALAGCHDAATPSFGYDFSKYEGAQLAVSSGRLLGAIKHESGFQPMPKGMSILSDCNINKLSAWINKGALNN